MGGGAMRTAAKAAAFSGFRAPTGAVRRASVPPATAGAVHFTEDAVAGESAPPSISMVSSEKVSAVGQWPAWEIDDWEFAGVEEVEKDLFDPPPRLVFGSPPTLEEAKEATDDLKEALEKVYFSTGAEDSVNVRQVAGPSQNAAVLPAVPKHVVQAFSLLQGSPEAQSVVASLASDRNVWDAVMKNEKVLEFYKNSQPIVLPPETSLAPEESVGENENIEEQSKSEQSPMKENSEGSEFNVWVQNIKVKVSKMVSNISDFLQDYLMGPSTENRGPENTKTSTSTAGNYADLALGASFIGLAIAVILVVLVKRG